MITTSIRNAETIRTKLASLEPKVLAGVERAVKIEALNLVKVVKGKLSDDVLKVRTGRLRRSITAKFEGAGTGTFRALVGTNVKYARVHELGFQGSVTVPQHSVKSFQRMQKKAFGKDMKNPRMVNVRAHEVKSHAMKMNMPARPFLKPSLDQNLPRITTNIRKALAEALK